MFLGNSILTLSPEVVVTSLQGKYDSNFFFLRINFLMFMGYSVDPPFKDLVDKFATIPLKSLPEQELWGQPCFSFSKLNIYN